MPRSGMAMSKLFGCFVLGMSITLSVDYDLDRNSESNAGKVTFFIRYTPFLSESNGRHSLPLLEHLMKPGELTSQSLFSNDIFFNSIIFSNLSNLATKTPPSPCWHKRGKRRNSDASSDKRTPVKRHSTASGTSVAHRST